MKNSKTNLEYKEITTCLICNNICTKVANFPNFPITELFINKAQNIDFPATSADQALMYCENCSHMFLQNHLPKNFIYSNYVLESSLSRSASLSSNNFYKFIKQRSKISTGAAIDIGANDTFLLKKFSENTFERIGIDPNIKSDESSITCISDYFENCDMQNITKKNKLILCSHTLEHVYDVNGFLNSISQNLSANDEVFFQFPSLDLLVKDARFDQINHQHLNYFSLFSIQKILTIHNLKILDHFFDHDHFGTLMCHVVKDENTSKDTKSFKQNVSKDCIDTAYAIFNKNVEATTLRLEFFKGDFFCFGASLTLPVLCYFVPEIRNSICVIDSDQNKEHMKFANVPLSIKHDSLVDFPANNFLVSAISSKSTARKIVELLLKREALNIFVLLNIL